jgi:hypothetical protein
MNPANTDVAFIAGTAVVLVGLAIWIAVFFRRASRIVRSGSGRLDDSLSSLSPPPAGMAPQIPASSTGSSIAWDTLPWNDPQVADRRDVDPAADSSTPVPGSIESRLAELGELHARHLISDDELAAARAKVLAE